LTALRRQGYQSNLAFHLMLSTDDTSYDPVSPEQEKARHESPFPLISSFKHRPNTSFKPTPLTRRLLMEAIQEAGKKTLIRSQNHPLPLLIPPHRQHFHHCKQAMATQGSSRARGKRVVTTPDIIVEPPSPPKADTETARLTRSAASDVQQQGLLRVPPLSPTKRERSSLYTSIHPSDTPRTRQKRTFAATSSASKVSGSQVPSKRSRSNPAPEPDEEEQEGCHSRLLHPPDKDRSKWTAEEKASWADDQCSAIWDMTEEKKERDEASTLNKEIWRLYSSKRSHAGASIKFQQHCERMESLYKSLGK